MKYLAWVFVLYAVGLVAQEKASPLKRIEIDCVALAPGSDAKPVAGAKVWVALAANYNQDAAQDKTLGSGTTDARGHCKVGIEVVDDGTIRYGTILVKSDAGSGGQTSILAFPHLADKPPVVEVRLHELAECRVRLTKPDGAPASGVRVWVEECNMPEDSRGFMYSTSYNVPQLPDVGWQATTDAEGRCTITGLPKDAFLYLRHDAAGLAQLPNKYISHSPQSPRANGREASFRLVTAGTLRGRVTLPDGSPASGGHVRLLEMGPYQTAFGTMAQADAEGRFEITQIPPSNYNLTFRSALRDEDRWIGDQKDHLHVQAGQVTDAGDLALSPVAIVTGRVLDAESGEEIEKPIIFRLKAGTHALSYRTQRAGSETHIAPGPRDAIPVTIATGERKSIEFRLQRVKAENKVSCVVVDENGKPAPRAMVAMLGGNAGESFNLPRQTDDEGAYTFQVTTPKDRLSILAWTDDAISEFTEVKAGGAATVRLQASGHGSIHGQIVDDGGRPVAGANFQVGYDVDTNIMGGPLPEHVKVGEDGRFRVPRIPHSIKEVTLFAYLDGYSKAALRDQPLQPGQALEWKPVLRSTRGLKERIEGVVVDKADAPVPGAKVTVSGDAQPDGIKPVITDAAGRFRFEKLAAGQAFVKAEQKTERLSRDTYLWTQASKTDLKLVLPEADGSMSGTVLDHRGRPAAGAEVDAFSRGRKTTADAQGRFTLSGLERGWFSADVTFLAADGTRTEHRIRLKTGMKDRRLTLPEKNEERDFSSRPISLIGKPAPEIHITTWINTPPLAAKAGGKVRILDFWGMECGPCLAGFPKVQKFWEAHQADGIEIVASGSGFYPEAEVREFLQRHPGYTFPFAIRPESASDGIDYGVKGIPFYVVIGKDGTVLSTGHDWDEAAAHALKAAGK